MEHRNSSNTSLAATVSGEMVAGSIVLGLCFALGVPGNIAVMVRLSGWLKEKSLTPRLMLSLAVSDLVTLLPLPVFICDSFLTDWIFGLFLCKFISYLLYWGYYCSTVCVTVLSVQRYMQVLHPQKYAKLGGRGQKILLSCIWMLSLVLASYALVQYTIFLGHDEHEECDLKYLNDTEKVATLVWETLMFFLLFFLMAYFYFRLYKGVTRSAFFRSHTMTKLVTRIVVTFFIFRIPYNIEKLVYIVALLLKNGSLMKSAEGAYKITRTLMLINSTVNPFLYAFSARAIRQPPSGSENAS